MRVAAAFGASAGIAMLAGCSELHTISAIPTQVANGSSAYPLVSNGYKSLYSFK